MLSGDRLPNERLSISSTNPNSLVRLLAIVSHPRALGYLHIGELSRERRLFGRTGIDSKTDFVDTGIHVAYAHLAEIHTIGRALDAVVIFTP